MKLKSLFKIALAISLLLLCILLLLESMFQIGNYYLSFNGNSDGHPDYVKISRWVKCPAYLGHKRAQYLLSICCSEVAPSKELNWLRISADGGCVDAEIDLAISYCEGYLNLPKDIGKAAYWYKRAANQGDGYAQYKLGTFYAKGIGVRQDYKQSVYWYKQSTEQGYEQALFLLSIMLYRQKSNDSLHYLLMAYENKDIEWNAKADVAKKISACYRFGVCGAIKNEAEADAWNKKAAELGEPDAKEIEKWLNSNNMR